MQSQALATTSAPHSKPCNSQSAKTQLIRLWIGKLALNAGQALKSVDLGVTEALWLEGFDDLSYDVLEAALKKALKVCKFWPVKVADIREQVVRREENAAIFAADQKWQRVMTFCDVYVSPDFQGGVVPRAPSIGERTMTAIRAAGGLLYLHDCSLEDLQWAKKRFVESYIAWETLKRDEHLLPDSPVKDLIAGAAEQKLLPSYSTYEDAHIRGLAYAQELKDSDCAQPDIQRTIRAVAGEFAPRPPARSPDEQKQILRDRGLLK